MKKILIIGAMEVETQGLADRLERAEDRLCGAFRVREGTIAGVRALVCRCGIGKVNASAAASAVLTEIPGISLVLNLGVAGGIGMGIRQGDAVVASRTVQHDYNQTPDGFPAGQIPGFDSPYFACDPEAVSKMSAVLTQKGFRYRVGTTASGDQFICSREKAAEIAERFGADACDMESAAVAQVCALFGVPFLSMRAISDGGDDGAVQSFYAFVETAAARSAEAVEAFCKVL